MRSRNTTWRSSNSPRRSSPARSASSRRRCSNSMPRKRRRTWSRPRFRSTRDEMPAALGLTTYRWNNNTKSILLILAFPALLLVLFGGIFFVYGLLMSGPSDEYGPLGALQQLG